MHDNPLCRLVGGRYDGDEGHLQPPLPFLIYAYACPSGNPRCTEGGVHWRTHRPLKPRAVRYERDVLTDAGVQLYRCRDLARPAALQGAATDAPLEVA